MSLGVWCEVILELKLCVPLHVQTKGISEQTLKDVSLTYITPEKLFGHRGSMAGQDPDSSAVFHYLGASGSTLVSFSTDCRMEDGVVRHWTGAPSLSSSKEFKSYKGIEQIVPLARKIGFVARCGDGFIRRYDRTVESLASAAQPKAEAKFYLSDKVPAARDTFVTNVCVKADGKWMLVTTSAAIYLTNWVDDDVKDEDFVIAELGLQDPAVKVPDFGDYEFHAAKFDSSIEDDVTNADMCEMHIGAFIKPGEDAVYTDTVMVQWRLRDVFSGDNLKIKPGTGGEDDDDKTVPVLKAGICKLYGEHGSNSNSKLKKSKSKLDGEDKEAPLPAAPVASVVDEWTWHKGSHAIATLGDAMKTMQIQT